MISKKYKKTKNKKVVLRVSLIKRMIITGNR